MQDFKDILLMVFKSLWSGFILISFVVLLGVIAKAGFSMFMLGWNLIPAI